MLFEIRGAGAGRFEYFYACNGAVPAREGRFEFFVDIPGDVFRGWIDVKGIEHGIEVLVVEFAEYFFQVFFEDAEINAKTFFIERFAAHVCAHEPVVSMHIFAWPLVVPEAVGR